MLANLMLMKDYLVVNITANTKIFNQEKIVNKLVEEVSIINDKTEYA